MVEALSGGVLSVIEALLQEPTMEVYDHIIAYGLRRSDLERAKGNINAKFIPWSHVGRQISVIDDARASRDLARIVREVQPDVIHCHSSKAGALGRLVAFMMGMRQRVIYTPHGVSFLRKDISQFKRVTFGLVEKTLGRMCFAVVACSPSERVELSSIGINSVLVPNGLKISDIRLPSSAKNRNKPITIVTSGRISRQKNPERFAQIAKAFLGEANFRFVWIGDGDLREQLNLPNISVTGWLSSENVKEQLRKADVYLSTSDWEGLPLAVLEAMGAHLPLLLFDCVGNRDLVSKDNGYLYVNPTEAVAWLREIERNRACLEKLGNSSFTIVNREFNVERQANLYRDLYGNALGVSTEQ